MRFIRNLWNVYCEYLELIAAELRTGRKLVEAVNIEAANLELLAVTGSEASAQDARLMAVELCKNGIRQEEIAEMAHIYHIAKVCNVGADNIKAIFYARTKAGGIR